MMEYPSKPLVITLTIVRENPVGAAHGDTHLVLGIKWARKRTDTLCGKSVEGMRKMGNPFDGWAEVLCTECATRIEK